ncbi:MAG: hypothetical protein IAF38_10560 [Bacteroidia bacterium]|nr:hypothetical protein [Bacteroidia bacterium]
MNKKFVNIKRSLLSFLFLLILVFPTIEKGFHDYGHADDEHCGDTITLHFHKAEHDCSLCDYQVSPGVQTEPELSFSVRSEQFISFSVAPVQSECGDRYGLLSARGPPTV